MSSAPRHPRVRSSRPVCQDPSSKPVPAFLTFRRGVPGSQKETGAKLRASSAERCWGGWNEHLRMLVGVSGRPAGSAAGSDSAPPLWALRRRRVCRGAGGLARPVCSLPRSLPRRQWFAPNIPPRAAGAAARPASGWCRALYPVSARPRLRRCCRDAVPVSLRVPGVQPLALCLPEGIVRWGRSTG